MTGPDGPQRPRRIDWRRVADRLAARLYHHAYCSDHSQLWHGPDATNMLVYLLSGITQYLRRVEAGL